MGKGYARATGSLIMCIFCFMAYGPMALQIDEYATNATLTNAVWTLLDAVFPLFWTLVIISWLIASLYFVLKEIS